jgi:hypothetical protein
MGRILRGIAVSAATAIAYEAGKVAARIAAEEAPAIWRRIRPHSPATAGSAWEEEGDRLDAEGFGAWVKERARHD